MRSRLPHNSTTLSIGVKQDLRSLSQIHDAAYPVIFRYIAFWVKDKEVATQLTNELFTILLEQANTNYDPQFPEQLLLSLAMRVVRAYQNNNIHPVRTTFSDAKLQTALAKLPEEQQILLALLYGCHLTIEQTAQVLDQSPEAVRHLQVQAIMEIHAQMKSLDPSPRALTS